jgi:hypothetical protein
MSKLHAVREDVKLRIAEVRDDVMKEPTLSIGEKKEVTSLCRASMSVTAILEGRYEHGYVTVRPYSPSPLLSHLASCPSLDRHPDLG